MEYVYAAMLLHKAGKEINEDNVKKVLQGAGVTPDEAKVKALVTALQGVNIEEAIKKAAVTPVAAPAASGGEETSAKEEKKEDEKKKKEDDKKAEEQAAAGLGALFG